MTTIALNNLLTYILSLRLSKGNRQWLAEKLISFDDEVTQDKGMDALKKSFGSHADENQSYPINQFIEDINIMSQGKDFINELL